MTWKLTRNGRHWVISLSYIMSFKGGLVQKFRSVPETYVCWIYRFSMCDVGFDNTVS